MTDDTTRRERAEKYIEDDTTVWANEWTWEGEDIINAYLAGAREEAEIRSEEVERLESVARGLKQCCEECRAEIAALREACREVLDYEQGNGEYDYSCLPSLERAEASFLAWLEVREKVRRALKEGNKNG